MNTEKKKRYINLTSVLNSARDLFAKYIYIDANNGEERKELLEQKLFFVLKGIGFGILSFVFSTSAVMFSAYPLGIALLSASEKFTPFVYVGAIIASLYLPFDATATFLAMTLILILRVLAYAKFQRDSELGIFREKALFRAVCCASGALMLGSYRAISGGFLYYDLFALLTLVGISVPLCLMYTLAFDDRYIHSSLRDMGLLSLTASFIYTVRSVALFGFSVGAVVLFIGTLYVARECGMLKGGVLGLVCGLAYSVQLSPMFALIGLVGGFFSRVGTLGATVTSLGIAVLYSVYLDGTSALIRLAPDLLTASIIYLPLAKLNLLPKLGIFSSLDKGDEEEMSNAKEKEKMKMQTEKFCEMRDAFSTLADVCFKLSEKNKIPRPDEIAVGCENVLRRHCLDCSKYQNCRDTSGNTSISCAKSLSKELFRNRQVTEDNLPEYIKRKCFKLDKVIDDINCEYLDLLEKRLRENKADIFGADYEAMSRLIGDAIEQTESENETDTVLTKKAIRAANYIGFTARSVIVCGKHRKRLICRGVDMARIKTGADDLRRLFGKVCNMKFQPPMFSVDGDFVTMTMLQRDGFKCDFSRLFLQKQGENVCGDSVVHFKGGDGYEYVLLSDGMGSGYEAALTSRLCGVFLEKMLRSGNRKDVTLEMLNSLIRSKSPECFATIDLLEIDLVSGMACFVKSGSAPSYVLRNGNLFRIESDSSPIGITRKITGEKVDFALSDGDIVVMISDGIAQSFEDGLWLCDLITEKGDSVTPDELCSLILESGKEKNERCDDMSVAVCKISCRE